MILYNDATLTTGGLPSGIVVPYLCQLNKEGYLECDGSTYDTEKYPGLYDVLGTNVLPDYREVTLVGVGENTTDSIAAHDTFTVGQFKDDQLQTHRHTYNNITTRTQVATQNGAPRQATDTSRTSGGATGRTASVTRSKSVGVYFYINAGHLNYTFFKKGVAMTYHHADGIKLGQVVILPFKMESADYLECNGAKVPSQYQDLMHLIGKTLPDYREVSLVGVGERASGSATHDVFTIGQFKDDQLQSHTHTYLWPNSLYKWNDSTSGGGPRNNYNSANFGENSGRKGTVTRDKSKGVYYYIKAVI